MATYEIKAPDGKTYEIEGEPGATQAQVQAEVVRQNPHLAGNAPKTPQKPKPSGNISMGTFTGDPFSNEAKERSNKDAIAALSGIGQSLLDTMGMFGTNTPVGIKDGVMQFEGTPQIPKYSDDPRSKAIRTGFEWGTPMPGAKLSKVDPLIGVAAATGENLADETGEVIAGLSVIAADLLRGKYTPDVMDRAKQYIMELSVDGEKAMENLQQAIKDGRKGTLSQLTKDPNIANIESGAKPGSQLKRDLDEVTQGRFNQLGEDISSQFGDVNIPYRAQENVKQAAGGYVDKVEQGLTNRGKRQLDKTLTNLESQLPKAEDDVLLAQDKLDAAENKISTTMLPSQAGERLEKGFNLAEDAFNKREVKPLWDKFSNGDPLNVDEVIQGSIDWLDTLDPTRFKMVTKDQNDMFDLISQWSKKGENLVSPDEVHTVISQLKSKYNAAIKDKGSPDQYDKLMNELRISLEDSLKGLGDENAYNKAVSASKEQYKRFNTGRIAKERIPSKLDENELKTFGQRTIRNTSGEGGAVIGDLILQAKTPALESRAKTYIKSIVPKKGVDDNFLERYEELLSKFPNLRDDLIKAKNAQDNLVLAKEKVAALPKTIETKSNLATRLSEEKTGRLTKSLNKRQIAQLSNDPEKFIDNSLKSRSAEDLTEAYKQMGKVKGGQKKLKQAIQDRFMKKIVKNSDGTTSIPPASVGEFRGMKQNLVDSGILTKDEADVIEGAISEAKFTHGLKKSSAKQQVAKADSTIDDIFASGIAVAVLNRVPNSTNQLMIASTIKRAIKKKITGSEYDDKAVAALESILANPEKLLNDVVEQGLTTEQKFLQYLSRAETAFTQSAED